MGPTKSTYTKSIAATSRLDEKICNSLDYLLTLGGGSARFVCHFWVWNILVALLSLWHFWVCKISVALWLWVQYFSGSFGSAIFFVALFGLQDFGEGSPPLWDFLLTGDGSHAKHLQRVWLRGGGKTMQIVPKKSSLQNDWENNITSNFSTPPESNFFLFFCKKILNSEGG